MDPVQLTPATTPQGQTVYLPITLEAGRRLSQPPSYVQIDVPQRIPPVLRQAFEAGRKRLVLIISASQERLPAFVAEFGETALVADVDASTLWRKPGEKVVAIFPTPEQSYIMQTVIEVVAVQRLTLRYQDPRYDVRRHTPLTSSVCLCPVLQAKVEAIDHRQVRLVRAIRQPADGDGGVCVIADRIIDDAATEPSSALSGSDDAATLTCSLKDLSLGGAAVTYAAPPLAEPLAHRVIHLQIALPELPAVPPEPADPPLMLDLLAVIRQVETTCSPWILHIRFVARLPQACEAYFERLERYLASTSPLSE